MATASDKISMGHQPDQLRDKVQHTFSVPTTDSISDRGREGACNVKDFCSKTTLTDCPRTVY